MEVALERLGTASARQVVKRILSFIYTNLSAEDLRGRDPKKHTIFLLDKYCEKYPKLLANIAITYTLDVRMLGNMVQRMCEEELEKRVSLLRLISNIQE